GSVPVGAVGAGGGSVRHDISVPDALAICQGAGGRNIGRRVGLGQVDIGRGQNRGVVGAEDVDLHRGVGAVGAHHVEVLGVVRPGDRKSIRLNCSLSPSAYGGYRLRAIGAV